MNQLALFNFTIKYKPGLENGTADILSRLKKAKSNCESSSTARESSDLDELAASTALPKELMRKIAVESIEVQEKEDDHQNLENLAGQATNLPKLPVSDMKILQQEDPVISRLSHFKKLGRRSDAKEREQEDAVALKLMRITDWNRMVEKNGVWYRKCQNKNGTAIHQLYYQNLCMKKFLHNFMIRQVIKAVTVLRL